jgi:hypothetical protein
MRAAEVPSQNGRLARPFDVGLKLARTYWQDMLDCLSQGDFGEAGDRNLPRLAASGTRADFALGAVR